VYPSVPEARKDAIHGDLPCIDHEFLRSFILKSVIFARF
jgi:hypothetical protein